MAPRGSEVARSGVLRPELLHLPAVFQVWAEIHVSSPCPRRERVCGARSDTGVPSSSRFLHLEGVWVEVCLV